MGDCWSGNRRVQPSEFDRVRSFDSNSETSDDFHEENRKTTDVCALTFLAIFLAVLCCFLGYCISKGNIYRLINGYDDCGYVCGTINEIHDRRHCNDNDKTAELYYIGWKGSSNGVKRLCVSNCNSFDGYRNFLNRCVPTEQGEAIDSIFSKTGLKNFFIEISEDFHICWREFCYLCLISLGLSIIIVILFRYVVGLVVWVLLLGAVFGSSATSLILWLLYKESTEQEQNQNLIDPANTDTYFSFAILSSIVTVVVILIIFVMRNRIRLVVQLFEESGKSIAAMPGLLLLPILTFIFLSIVVFLWFYFFLWIESAGILVEGDPGVYYYMKNDWILFTRWYNFFAMLWMVQFLIGCQHMVIAGAVSTWYFERNKSALYNPIIQSFYNLTRFHLGSVALGSFLITIVQFVCFILKFMEKCLMAKTGKFGRYLLKCCQCRLSCFEKFWRYINLNAYIEVAIHGHSFYFSGRRAFGLLSSNILRVAAINSVGDFVLLMGRVVVVIATVVAGIKIFQGYAVEIAVLPPFLTFVFVYMPLGTRIISFGHKEGVQHIWVPITLAGLFAYFVANCFLTVYEVAIDTIFLCFCKDCEVNDGLSRPYFMSRGLMEFVENSRKALDVLAFKSTRRANVRNNISTLSGAVEQHLI